MANSLVEGLLKRRLDYLGWTFEEMKQFSAYWESLHTGKEEIIVMSEANTRQVGGSHYKQADGGEEHWDRQYRMFGPAYHIGRITAYVERYQKKNGMQDLEKGLHFYQKLIELEKANPSCAATGKANDVKIPSRCHQYWRTDDQTCILEEGHDGECVFHAKASDMRTGTGEWDVRTTYRGNWMTRQAGEHKPDGWVGYTFEGADATGFRYRCKACREHFRVPTVIEAPSDAHYCTTEAPTGAPTPAYVNQGGYADSLLADSNTPLPPADLHP